MGLIFVESRLFGSVNSAGFKKSIYDAHVVDGVARFEEGQEIPLKKEHVSMYIEYEKILEALKEKILKEGSEFEKKRIEGSEFCLGEDVSSICSTGSHSDGW